jgi:hypothetical protein
LFFAALPYKLINDAAQFVGPLILNRLLSVVAAQAAAAASDGSNSSSSSSAGVPGAGGGGDLWGALADWLAALGLNDPLGSGYSLSLLMFFGTVLGVLADNQVGTEPCCLVRIVFIRFTGKAFTAAVTETAHTALLNFLHVDGHKLLHVLPTHCPWYTHLCKEVAYGCCHQCCHRCTCPATSCALPPCAAAQTNQRVHVCFCCWLQHFQRVMRAGFRLKAILTAEVYRKVCCLMLSST